VQNFHFSPDFKGYNLIVSRDFLSESLGNNRTLPSEVIASKRRRPAQSLQTEEVALLKDPIKRLIYYIGQTGNGFQRNLIMSQFLILMMEMGNINLNKTAGGKSVRITHREQIVSRFFELLSLHAKEKHEVTFYAKELCITPEYLSRIVKVFSGKTVNKWISAALMTEAKILLRNPSLSVQQIADLLYFSDQSSFGKFFKKHSEISPLEYRKMER
jgi:AraC-like DNA-binding protein